MAEDTSIAHRKIFIGGLSYGTDDEKLRKYFSAFGTVQDAIVMKDPVSRRSRGFGFVTYKDVASADNALTNDPHTIDSRKVEAKRSVPRMDGSWESGNQSSGGQSKPGMGGQGDVGKEHGSSSSQTAPSGAHTEQGQHTASAPRKTEPERQGGGGSNLAADPRINMEEYAHKKIFVGGLHYDTRDAEFKAYFEQYGKIISTEVMFNRETHKSRGFGFIVFEHEKGADAVCAVPEHVINGKEVEVKKAIPRSKIAPGTSSATIASSGLANADRSEGQPVPQPSGSVSSGDLEQSAITSDAGGASTNNAAATSASVPINYAVVASHGASVRQASVAKKQFASAVMNIGQAIRKPSSSSSSEQGSAPGGSRHGSGNRARVASKDANNVNAGVYEVAGAVHQKGSKGRNQGKDRLIQGSQQGGNKHRQQAQAESVPSTARANAQPGVEKGSKLSRPPASYAAALKLKLSQAEQAKQTVSGQDSNSTSITNHMNSASDSTDSVETVEGAESIARTGLDPTPSGDTTTMPTTNAHTGNQYLAALTGELSGADVRALTRSPPLLGNPGPVQPARTSPGSLDKVLMGGDLMASMGHHGSGEAKRSQERSQSILSYNSDSGSDHPSLGSFGDLNSLSVLAGNSSVGGASWTTGTTMGDNGSLVNSGVGAISGSATTASLSGLSWLQGGGGLSVDAEASSVVSNASHGSIGHSSLDDRLETHTLSDTHSQRSGTMGSDKDSSIGGVSGLSATGSQHSSQEQLSSHNLQHRDGLSSQQRAQQDWQWQQQQQWQLQQQYQQHQFAPHGGFYGQQSSLGYGYPPNPPYGLSDPGHHGNAPNQGHPGGGGGNSHGQNMQSAGYGGRSDSAPGIQSISQGGNANWGNSPNRHGNGQQQYVQPQYQGQSGGFGPTGSSFGGPHPGQTGFAVPARGHYPGQQGGWGQHPNRHQQGGHGGYNSGNGNPSNSAGGHRLPAQGQEQNLGSERDDNSRDDSNSLRALNFPELSLNSMDFSPTNGPNLGSHSAEGSSALNPPK